uniref:Immunoglobulin domain-containing protein n=1 Tax=Sinocyclocheilus rhinocerous TaxID=307959 RepID=A0A673MMJ4_9TELE
MYSGGECNIAFRSALVPQPEKHISQITVPICFPGVFGETKLVNEGESVTLFPRLTEIKKDDVIDWRFEKILIARVRNNNNPTTYDDELDGKFRGRLKLNGQTGDLTITNIKSTDSGVYEITNSINTIRKTFSVSDTDAPVTVMVGDSVALHTDVPDIQRYDVIRWRFGQQTSPIAEINRKAGIFNTSDGPDGRFRDRLQLDNQTGSLTIKSIGTKHSGLYEVDISSSKHTIHKTFSVTVSGESITVILKVIFILAYISIGASHS